MAKRKVLAGLGIGLAASLALGGCSGAADDGTVTLQMVESLTNPARTELLNELIGEFEEANPDIQVELVSPPTDQADQKIQQMLQSGSGVDVGAPVNALRLVRLPAGLARTHAEADALRDRVVREHAVEAAFTSFDGVGYYRLSTHAYNTARDFEEFAERMVPTLCEWASDTSR